MPLDHLGIWSIYEPAFAQLLDAVGLEGLAQAERAPAVATPAAEIDGQVAIIEIAGPTAKSMPIWAGGTSTLALRLAVAMAGADAEIGAVVLKIDSPGGTVSGQQALSSDIAALAQQKPVLAYIDDLGASAAYWTASQARSIYTNETAFVGSIGTYGVVYDFSRMAENAGVQARLFTTGKFKGMGTPGTPLSDEQADMLQSRIEQLNEFFLQGVSDGRGLSMETVRELATGEVWIGQQAAERGLTDGVRTFDEVLAEARSLAGETPSGRRAPMAATIQELKAACPGAPSDFLMEQLEAEADAETAKGNYIALLQLQSEENAQAAEKAKAEAEEARKASAEAGAGLDKGLTAGNREDEKGEDEPGGDAKAEFEAKVDEHTKRGVPRHVAVARVCREHPELSEAFVADHNARHLPVRVQLKNQRRKEVAQ